MDASAVAAAVEFLARDQTARVVDFHRRVRIDHFSLARRDVEGLQARSRFRGEILDFHIAEIDPRPVTLQGNRADFRSIRQRFSGM